MFKAVSLQLSLWCGIPHLQEKHLSLFEVWDCHTMTAAGSAAGGTHALHSTAGDLLTQVVMLLHSSVTFPLASLVILPSCLPGNQFLWAECCQQQIKSFLQKASSSNMLNYTSCPLATLKFLLLFTHTKPWCLYKQT